MKLDLKGRINAKDLAKKGVYALFLIFIIYLGFHIRALNVPNMVSDYDPHWYYRHSLDVSNNGFNLPKWDILSYYPPGRPYEKHEGLEYTLVFFYNLLGKLFNMTFMKFFIISPAVIAGLSAIPAYLATRYMSKSNLGALFAALFAVVASSFIGYSVSGYMDSKVFVVFYSFLSIYSLMLFMKRKDLPSFALSVATNLLFVYTWSVGGWYPLISFLFLLPAIFIFRIFEEMIHKSFKVDLKPIIQEQKSLLIPFLIIMLTVNVITQIFISENVIQSILIASGFAGFAPSLLVNISVAELQPINILTVNGFFQVANSVGLLPMVLTLFGLPSLMLFKIWRKEKIVMEEIFLLLFALAAFYMILHGTRFALIFSVVTSLSAGYFIANAYRYLKDKNYLFITLFLAFVTTSSLFLISNSFIVGDQSSKGYGVSQNWIDSLNWLKTNGNSSTLVVTWWDPGHIITDLAGLKVMADGAHCSPDECIPYNHNIRIQDMGRVFSISNETEALNILKKYQALTLDQCNQAGAKYGSIVPANACDPITKMYLLATSDLIGKYYWLTYFGTGTGRTYTQCNFNQQLSQQLSAYSYLCATSVPTAISLTQNNNSVVAVINSPQQGMRNVIARQVMLYQNGKPYYFDYSNSSGVVDGLVFVDPSLQVVIYMDAKTRDSLFTNMFFFNGQGMPQFNIPPLNGFNMVYQNPEVKIYEVNLGAVQ